MTFESLYEDRQTLMAILRCVNGDALADALITFGPSPRSVELLKEAGADLVTYDALVEDAVSHHPWKKVQVTDPLA